MNIDCNIGDEKWLDSGYIFKVERIRVADRLAMR